MRAALILAGAILLGSVLHASAACGVGSGGGALGYDTNNSTVYSSENLLNGGLAATFTVTNGIFDPAYTIFVSAPSVVGPTGFDSGATVLVSYTALGVGVSKTQAFTSSATTIAATAASVAVVITMNMRIVSTAGFRAGPYTAKVTVTCAPS